MTIRHGILGAAEHLPETWVSGDTLVPWAEQTMRWADEWSVCLAGGEVVRDVDTRLEHDQELWWVDGFVAYPPCVAYHDWRLDLNERAVFPSCADGVLTDVALDACARADDCQACLTALAEANKRACSPAARILLALEQWCRPDRYDYRELWGR